MVITNFYIKNLRWLYIVFILTFCSAFGQTFFISLYSGEIRAAFDLTHGQWGLIYSCATLSSAILILFVGGYADRIKAKDLSTFIILGLISYAFTANPFSIRFLIIGKPMLPAPMKPIVGFNLFDTFIIRSSRILTDKNLL